MVDVFITENFLLQTEAAQRLYHEYAKPMPIFDYHSHLPVQQIAEDRQFENLTQVWLAGDHYKWRAMRTAGVPERYCTGDASDWEKFLKWAETLPKLLRNPLYHWTHMELKRPFGISDRLLSPATAKEIWEHCNRLLAEKEFSARGLLCQMNVVLLCTTDDPTDTLEHHQRIAADSSFPIRVLPTFRPDRALAVEHPEAFRAWVDRLSQVSGVRIQDFDSLLEALRRRHDAFHAAGCRLADHGLTIFYAEQYTAREVDSAFQQVYHQGKMVEPELAAKYKSALLFELARMNAQKDWTQQFHFGCMRNNNTRAFQTLGPDTGFDSIGDWPQAVAMSRFFDRLEQHGQLTRTILYNLNPADNEMVATMIGNFQDGQTPGKMQMGSAWWFLDQKDGIERQIEALSNMGLLSQFVGMLTDSRSFLSFIRHEYFRRILCNILGQDMTEGLLPWDFDLVGQMVQDICYRNAVRYFKIEGVPMV
ncbi:MAG: glucuronate isomerase [Thermoguttaceae bacterium]|nr:glucuronate isomerase [Thermoguttaceae bacterium]MDW8037169.1 glucuronate isomerase [Thermoguttaceae bacterium]